MVGLIQKLLFDMIKQMGGESVLTQVKLEAALPPEYEYQINLVYSDEEWQRLFAATLKVLNITAEQAYEAYADYFMKDVTKRFPTWVSMTKNSYEFLLMQPTIHNCFATSVLDQTSREAITDKFRVEKFPNKIITHYCSPNQQCGLYKAIARWLFNFYKDDVEIEETKCMNSGEKECEIHFHWKTAPE